MTNKDIALKYLKHGFSVIPLWSPAMLKRNPPKSYFNELETKLKANAQGTKPEPGDTIKRKLFYDKCKRPIVGWTEYQKRLPTEEEVKGWFDQNPDANIGIVTGKVSGIVVFDLDS